MTVVAGYTQSELHYAPGKYFFNTQSHNHGPVICYLGISYLNIQSIT